MKLRLTFFLLASIQIFTLKAQVIDTANTPIWIEMMQDPNANFFETQNAFNIYWEGRERHPGDGWKVFKRWEDFWSTRVNPDGTFPNPDQVKVGYDNWEIAYSQTLNGSESITGDWIEVGPLTKPDNGTGQPNGNGRLNTIAFHPTNANTFWVGAPAGGLWKTTDGGQSWVSNTDNLPTLGVSSILIDPTNTNVMYIGTGDRDAGDSPGLGVYKSTDGGQTWFQSNSGMGNKVVGAMIMHPSNSSYILAATSGGVYRTTNGGSSWTLESNNSNYKDIKWKPGSSTIAYATETTSPAGFYKTTDGGDNWTEITTGLPTNSQRYVIGVSANDASVVYLLSSIASAYQGLYKSTDSGSSFTTQSTSPNLLGYAEDGSSSGGQGWYDLCIAVDPTNANTVFVGGVNIWKTTNSGTTWDCVAHWVGSSTAVSVHADQHWMAYNPLNNKLFACNDGGVYGSTDGGNTWPEYSSGIGVSQIYRIGVSQNTHELVINGYQDNGTAIWDDTLFRTERGGDGMECIIDPNNDNIMYCTVYYGNIVRSTNLGYGFSGFASNGTNGITEDGAWVTPYILDRQNSDVMFIGYKNIWRTENATSSPPTFIQISNNLAGSNTTNMRQIRQSKVNSNRLFAIRSDNKLFRSDNALGANPTWTDLSTNLPNVPSGSNTIKDIETSPFNNNIVWLIRGNYVYKSTNGGSSWANYYTSLPNISLNTLVADPLSNGGLYVGTDAGVYYIDNSMTAWIPFKDGLPLNSEITELEIYHPNGDWTASRIRAGTFGRGLWESDLYDPENIAPKAFIDLSLNSTEVCAYDTITLWNNSAYQPTSSQWTITPISGVTFVGGTSSSTYNPKIVISTAGTYNVKLVVSNSYGSDSVTINNALTVSAGVNLAFLENFENEALCSTSNCTNLCPLTNWKNMTNGTDDDIDFLVNYGSTPSGGTGPTVDYDPGTASGRYIYTEASWCFEQAALLESPCISLENVTNPKVSLAYHMYASTPSQMGSLAIEVKSNGVWSTLNTINGNQGNSWLTTTQNLSSYINQTVKIRLRANTGNQYQSDIAVDGIKVYGSPLTNFGANTLTPCVGETVQLTDSSSQNPTSWAWSISPNTFTFMNGTNSSSQNPQVRFDSPGIYSIIMQSINAYGGDFEVKNNFITASVPSPTLSTSTGSNTFCSADSIDFSTSANYINYNFKKNGISIQNGSSNHAVLIGFATGDQVVVEVTDSNGCIGTSNAIVLTIQNTISVDLTIDDEDFDICDGDTVTFTANAPAATNFTFFQNGNQVQNGATNTYQTNAIQSNDQFSVEATSSNGCIGTSGTITLNILPLPSTPSIALLMDSLHCTLMGQLYHWMHDTNSTINGSDMFAKQGDGTYKVRIFDAGCWSLWSEPFVITGIDRFGLATIKLYPSPANEFIVFEMDKNESISVNQLQLIDIQGKLIQTIDNQNNELENQTRIDISNLSNGVYLLIVKTNERNIAIQFVKEI